LHALLAEQLAPVELDVVLVVVVVVEVVVVVCVVVVVVVDELVDELDVLVVCVVVAVAPPPPNVSSLVLAQFETPNAKPTVTTPTRKRVRATDVPLVDIHLGYSLVALG